ncbi:hypothetical protein ACS0TY_023239 [Phlomoides rotata]
MDALCKDGKLGTAHAMFNDLHFIGLEPNVVTYNILITGCCRYGLLEEAMKVFDSMSSKNVTPDIYLGRPICLQRG